MISHLQSSECKLEAHGDIEHYIQQEGFELLRCLFQGYLDQLKSEQTINKSVLNSQDKPLSCVTKNTSRQLTTLFCEVTVSRVRYGEPNEKSIFPMDEQLLSTIKCS